MNKNAMTDVAMHAIKGGMPMKEAAQAAGVHRTTLWRALKKAKTATEQLERVRGGRKREALEMLLSEQMGLIYNALVRLPPEELDKQGASFLKDLARTGTVNMGIILDKISKHDEAAGIRDNEVIVRVEGMPQLSDSVLSIISGNGTKATPTTKPQPVEIDE